MILNLNTDYKAYLNIATLDTTYDTVMTTIISGIEQEVQDYLRFNLITAEYTHVFHGTGDSYLRLRQYPVTAVTKIEEWDGDEYNTLVSGTDYTRLVIVNDESVELENKTFIEARNKYRVTYNAGYANAAAIPYAIRLTMQKLLKLRWDETPMGRNTLGMASKSDSSGLSNSDSYYKSEYNKIIAVLNPYRRLNV